MLMKEITWAMWRAFVEDPTPGLLLAAVLNSVDVGVFFREAFVDAAESVCGIIFEDCELCDTIEKYYDTMKESVVFWHLDKIEDVVTGETEVDPPIVIAGDGSNLFEVTAINGKLSVNWYTGRKYLLGVGMTEEEVRDFLF